MLEMAKHIHFLFSSLWPLPDLEKLQKFFHRQGLSNICFLILVSVNAVAGLKPIATILADKHLITALPLGVAKNGKSLVINNKWLNPLSLSFCVVLVCFTSSWQQSNLRSQYLQGMCCHSPTLLLPSNSITSPINPPLTPAVPVTSR